MPRTKAAEKSMTEQETTALDEQTPVEPAAAESSARPTKRSWATRSAQPVAYNMFTAKDQTGQEKIFFKMLLPTGQTKPDEEIVEVFRAHKQSPEGYPTGLRYENDRVHGPVWKIQNDQMGRTVADHLMMSLDGLAKKLETAQAAGV
jgi:hypothetical protein